jgi:hypothetical protein
MVLNLERVFRDLKANPPDFRGGLGVWQVPDRVAGIDPPYR